MSGIQKNELFDKMITVDFIIGEQKGEPNSGAGENETYDVAERIQTSSTGRKQMMGISGQLNPGGTIANAVLKITNFYTSRPLSDYKLVQVTAGYKNGNQATIKGTIQNSYVENSPPDSVTTFELLLGNILEWSTFWFNKSYEAYTTAQSIFSDIASTLNLNLNYYVDMPLQILAPLDFNMLCQDAILLKLKNIFPTLVIRIEYGDMYVYDDNKGTGILWKLDYIKSAKKDAAGFTIIAPWNPAIKPGDSVQLNPLYFKQSFGGQNIANNLFVINVITFNFDTDKTNEMNFTSYSGAE
jgi:hypothetical protein